jgi:hypothetical protein
MSEAAFRAALTYRRAFSLAKSAMGADGKGVTFHKDRRRLEQVLVDRARAEVKPTRDAAWALADGVHEAVRGIEPRW